MDVRVDSNLIRAQRENRGWTQDHLARAAGLSLRTIQRIEKTGAASPESVTALAAVLAVAVADLRVAEPVPSKPRAIRLSIELPLRLALAVLSGALCALHFRWSAYGWSPPYELGLEWLDFGVAGALFAITVLCPYLKSGPGLVPRALALIAASALSYFCAVSALSTESWFSVAPVLTSFLLASLVGVAIVLVAAKMLIPLRVTPAFWLLGLAAALVGGAGMYANFEVFGDTAWSTIASYSVWHSLACIAIYRGQRSSDAESGLLAAFARTRGRFSIVPGWMRLALARI